MRKIWILIICCIIICMNFSTVWGISIQQDIEYQNIIQELEKTPDLYAGYYMDNGILHIVPLNNEKSINSMTDLKENANIDIIIDDAKVYSLEELNTAFEILRENRDNLGITGYAIDTIHNGMRIIAKEWNDEKKANIQQLIDVKNIQYVTDVTNVTNNTKKQIVLKLDTQQIEVNNKKIEYTGEPFFDNGEGVIYCHIRSIPQILQQQDLVLLWDEKTKSAFLKYKQSDTNVIQFIQQKNQMIIDNDMILENEILQKNNQMYISVDLLSDIFYVDIQVISDYDNIDNVLADEDEHTYRKLGYLKNDFEAVAKYIQQNIDADFTKDKFSHENWQTTKTNVERFRTNYLLGEFETDFSYHITSMNGQVIEIRRKGNPLYHFDGEIPKEQSVDAVINAIQKQNSRKDGFLKQEVFKKYDSAKNNFYLNVYCYEKQKDFATRGVYYFIMEEMPYSFQQNNIDIIENYIRKNIDEQFDFKQYQSDIINTENNDTIISLKDDTLTKKEYHIIVENNKVIGIYVIL